MILKYLMKTYDVKVFLYNNIHTSSYLIFALNLKKCLANILYINMMCNIMIILIPSLFSCARTIYDDWVKHHKLLRDGDPLSVHSPINKFVFITHEILSEAKNVRVLLSCGFFYVRYYIFRCVIKKIKKCMCWPSMGQ